MLGQLRASLRHRKIQKHDKLDAFEQVLLKTMELPSRNHKSTRVSYFWQTHRILQ